MHAENELPKATRDSEGKLAIPQTLGEEILNQTKSVARKINKNALAAQRRDGQQHQLAASYFLRLFKAGVAWGVSEGKWDYSIASIPSEEPSQDPKVRNIILRQLVDKNRQPIVKEHLGEGINSFRYIPTVIPTLWIREVVSQVYTEPITTRLIYSQAALVDLQ